MLALLLALAGCSSDSDEQPEAANLKVIGIEKVTADGPVRLSPDGRHLAQTGNDLCVTDRGGGAEKCVEKVKLDGRLAQWSPDGTKLVFTDDFFRFFREPDVWVYDVTTGDLRDLTDDATEKLDLTNPDPNADVDILPAWSPDGSTVWFARGDLDAERVDLMSVPAGGGDATKLGTVDCAVTTLSAMAWTADHVAWTCGLDDATVSIAGHDGGDAHKVVTSRKGADWSALSFSPDGLWLLADSLSQYAGYAGAAGGGARAVSVFGGDPVPVAGGKVAFPTWSPTGHAIAYVDLPGSVDVVSEPGGAPTKLRGGHVAAASGSVRLDWAPGVLLAAIDGESTLLTLG